MAEMYHLEFELLKAMSLQGQFHRIRLGAAGVKTGSKPKGRRGDDHTHGNTSKTKPQCKLNLFIEHKWTKATVARLIWQQLAPSWSLVRTAAPILPNILQPMIKVVTKTVQHWLILMLKSNLMINVIFFYTQQQIFIILFGLKMVNFYTNCWKSAMHYWQVRKWDGAS